MTFYRSDILLRQQFTVLLVYRFNNLQCLTFLQLQHFAELTFYIFNTLLSQQFIDLQFYQVLTFCHVSIFYFAISHYWYVLQILHFRNLAFFVLTFYRYDIVASWHFLLCRSTELTFYRFKILGSCHFLFLPFDIIDIL